MSIMLGMDYKNVIELWPSVTALAKDLGEKPETVKKWKFRNSIPSYHWSRLISAAQGRGYSLTFEQLSKIAKKNGRKAA